MDAREIDDVVERCMEAYAAYLINSDQSSVSYKGAQQAALSALRPGDELPGGMVVVPAAFVQAVRDYQSGDYNGGPHKPTDECDHGVPYYGICEVCIDQYFEAALAMLAAAKEGKDG